MAANLPECPASLKPIAHYLKCAQEHDARDPVVAYFARMHAMEVGLKLSTKQPAETNLLIGEHLPMRPESEPHKILSFLPCSHHGLVGNVKERARQQ